MTDRITTRVAAVDITRGLTVAGMLLVNHPGSWGALYAPLAHAPWHGWTPTDLIFPFFLFIVGITTYLSRKPPAKILRRGAIIILLGLAVNAFPFTLDRFPTLRYMGVLQRIGIVYICAALLARWLTRKQLVVATVVILLGYWAILASGPLEPPEATIAASVDRAVIGTPHLWKQSKTWDPEGPLSTIPAVATCLLGILAAEWVLTKRLRPLVIAGVAGIALGLAWDLVFPINKNLWTSSYVVFTAGCACVLLALTTWLVDVRGSRWWTRPAIVFGVNPLIAFVGSGLMARILGMTKLQPKIYKTAFAPYFEPRLASLLYALAFVAVWWAILEVLYRRKLILRV
ncbi:MAG TPA: heparan-alpha-glucosaminide N-acetyltransferase domain-containing protein [Thermoanaerobaculia bacterium]